MKLRIFSDVHLEFAPFVPPEVPAGVVVLAGDIGEGETGLNWARERFPHSQIVYVLGNHELYGQRLPEVFEFLGARARELGIHLLENGQVIIDGVRFLGATLWTNYALHARNEEQVGQLMAMARREMNDCRYIRHGRKRKKGRDRINCGHLLELHQASYAYLLRQLAEPFAGKTVVITHHAPHRSSVPPQFAGHPLTACYVSHLPELVRSPVDLWVHGHVHDSFDYTVEGTRVVTNPRGYRPPHDNPLFDPELVVEI